MTAAVRERIGLQRPMFWHWSLADDIMLAVSAAQATLGEERWEVAYAASHAMSLEEAVAAALGATVRP